MLKWTEYKRVIGAPELLFVVGRTLKRQGVKYTTIAALIGIGAMLAEVVGNRLGYDLSINNVRAILLPAAVALLTFGLGNSLVAISNLFSSERILMADANAMNLMEDRKKHDMAAHLEILWDRVFRYEVALRSVAESSHGAEQVKSYVEELIHFVRSWPTEMRNHFGIKEENLSEFAQHIEHFHPRIEEVIATKTGFVATASFSLKKSLPQKLEQSLTGFNFSLLEDWYDGAFFTPNDNKLNEQFAAHQSLRGIRQTVGIPMTVQIKESVSGHPDPLWFTLTMRKIGMSVGSMIHKMNKKYVPPTEPAYFNAQHFLWNHPETDQLIANDFTENPAAILEDIRSRRKEMTQKIFSQNQKAAHQQIFRMFGRDYRNALTLRLDYDIEFAAGLLDFEPNTDIEELQEFTCCKVYSRRRLIKKTAAAREHLQQIDTFLNEHLPEIPQHPRTLRAVRIGFHINRFQAQKLIQEDIQKAIEIIQTKIAPSENRYTQRLCLLRQHYELTRIQLFSYIRMIDELGEYDTEK